MTPEQMQNEADKLRHEAKQIILRQFGVNEGHSNGTLERFVDAVIGCAIIETAILQAKALKG